MDGSTYSDDSIFPNNELQAELYDDLRVDVWQSQELLWKFMTSQIVKETMQQHFWIQLFFFHAFSEDW